ncbi:MAG: sugar ABC transporter permease [Chloroflexi bacterium]|nr:sugar ABC transporter permease [Chloroflexota bacterium]
MAATVRRKRFRWRDVEGYLFIAPHIVGFLAFMLLPIVSSMYLSLNAWDMMSPPRFIGLRNFQQLLYADRLFWQVLGNTVYYVVLSVPPSVVLPLLLAVLLNQQVRGVSIYRAALFMPVVTSALAVGLAWAWLYDGQFGLFNYVLSLVGIKGPSWLSDPDLAMPAVVAVGVWQGLGYNMVIYLAGLQGIGQHLYEAATIDGAGRLRQFMHITVPLLTPSTFFTLVMGVIGSFQSFGLIYIMTNGGPLNSTNVYVYYLWQTAFGSSRMGYAAAMAWILAVIIFIITAIQFRLARTWVHYQ